MGFYPAPGPAVRALAARLRAPAGGTAILDPCAGEGEAVGILAGSLGLDPAGVYAVELDTDRADVCRDRLTGASILGPASALSAAISPRSFGLVYVNPPFDDEMGGGGREELTWAAAAIGWLVPGGVLALVVPESTANDQRLRKLLDAWLEEPAVFRFPAEYRPFRELAILGRRRRWADSGEDGPGVARGWPWFSTRSEGDGRPDNRDQPAALDDPGGPTWELPAAPGPRLWAKRDLTAREILQAVGASPVHRTLLAPARPRPRVRPPLAPNDGHMAVLIASGHLDGPVYPPGEPPHVVRGTSRKEKHLISSETVEDSKGNVTTVEQWADRVINTVRTVGADGTIRTFEQ